MLYTNENMKWWLYGTGSIFKQNRRMQFGQKLFILILYLEEIQLTPLDKLIQKLCTHIRIRNFKAETNIFTLFLKTVRCIQLFGHISVLINRKMKVLLICCSFQICRISVLCFLGLKLHVLRMKQCWWVHLYLVVLGMIFLFWGDINEQICILHFWAILFAR